MSPNKRGKTTKATPTTMSLEKSRDAFAMVSPYYDMFDVLLRDNIFDLLFMCNIVV